MECWLNVTQRRKVDGALAALTDRAGWQVAWGEPAYDAERRLFRVMGPMPAASGDLADALLDLLESLTRVTNHCVVAGPAREPDGGWDLRVYADGRQVEVVQVRSLSIALMRRRRNGGEHDRSPTATPPAR